MISFEVMRRWYITFALAGVMLVGACAKRRGQKGPIKTPTLEVFITVPCTFGVAAVAHLAEAKQKLGDAFVARVEFVGEERAGYAAPLCAMKQAPVRYLEMVRCQLDDQEHLDSNWRECAKKAGIEDTQLAACVEGPEGKGLLAASLKRAKELDVQSSPTLFLNGRHYAGPTKTRDIVGLMCLLHQRHPPKECLGLQQPPTFDTTFLSDARCSECDDMKRVEKRLKRDLPGLVAKHLDYASAEGRALYEKMSAGTKLKLPVILFAQGVTADVEGYEVFKPWVKPMGEYLQLEARSIFDPTAEICSNGADDTDADGLIDCADPDCAEAVTCREARPKQLDVFVMSHCPYGATAVQALDKLLAHFGDDLSIGIHYIGSVHGERLVSFHGEAEVDEDVRQVCAIAHYPKGHQFLKYIACRSSDFAGAWKPCAEKAGMNAADLEACASGEGKTLLADSFRFSASLGVSASPTLLVNNRRLAEGGSARDLQQQYCKDNPSLSRCAEQIPDVGAATKGQSHQVPEPASAR